ncbi:RNase III domain-containing protein [Mycena chlorophos]|uniref:RNase III domain-containing protein n=1 Tax=Mycena chlorophos TaxID=658473 RepID=A0A8H6S7E7_MYCCL|nr:RNase III domain-containing protein [Mycena chlorophos]
MAAPLPTFELPPLPTINDKALEKRAFTHTSYYGRPAAGFEDKADDLSPDYERLEFIGDSVIQLAVTGLLHEMYPGLRVGPASKLRSALVENASFAPISVQYGLPQRLLANPVQAMVLKNTQSVQADIFEAFIGAFYLDQGFDVVRPWLSELFRPLAEYHYAIIRAQHGHSTASEPAEASGYLVLLNQALQSQGIGNKVEWTFAGGDAALKDAPPEMQAQFDAHRGSGSGSKATPLWGCQLFVEGVHWGQGFGPTKKAAKNEAAKHAVSTHKTELGGFVGLGV